MLTSLGTSWGNSRPRGRAVQSAIGSQILRVTRSRILEEVRVSDLRGFERKGAETRFYALYNCDEQRTQKY